MFVIKLELCICGKKTREGLPLWLSGKESTCQCRRHRLNPWPWKILHATEQLSPHTTTTAPVLYSLGAATTEALTPHLESSPTCCSQRTACVTVKTQHNQKQTYKQQKYMKIKRKKYIYERKPGKYNFILHPPSRRPVRSTQPRTGEVPDEPVDAVVTARPPTIKVPSFPLVPGKITWVCKYPIFLTL